ncbi:hypothetical protein OCU04_006878 [Sclerotinia nivalis]|uniref:Uncharacterized protein n=1 Tax=Sclerotinia nivalis TaxID=352851 RepID=A0A9X0DKZ8_9HELO|nr:hypothetical protein OCU04_006878 [Sclerotinia nivalis]
MNAPVSGCTTIDGVWKYKTMVHTSILVRKLLQDINKLYYWVATDIGMSLILQREERVETCVEYRRYGTLCFNSHKWKVVWMKGDAEILNLDLSLRRITDSHT